MFNIFTHCYLCGVPGDDLDREEEDDGDPVEDVMHDGTGKGATEHGTVTDLSDRHDRVRNGRALWVKDENSA